MMAINHIRNIIALLLVLTVANLAASFAALHAVRTVRDDNNVRIQRVDASLTRLDGLVHQLCAEQHANCPTQQAQR